jgi:hypothetical protein
MMMSTLSKSTQLLNCLIALSTITPDFPHPLFDEGFQIEAIEPLFMLSDGISIINPDLQLKKNDNYLVFFECKDGYAEDDQRNRYKRITLADIKNANITTLPASRLIYDIAYFGTKDKEEKLIRSIGSDSSLFPLILFEENKITKHPDFCGFKIEKLNTIFNEIHFTIRPPESFIPFTPNDSTEIIKINLIRHFASKSSYEFTLDELLQELFPQIINNYSQQGKEVLKGRLGNILSELQNSEEFEEFITQKNGKYQLDIITIRKFKNACIKLIKKLEQDRKQQKLSGESAI